MKAAPIKTDSHIQTQVMQELLWDPSVPHEHIGVAVTDGIVSLSGTVPNYVEKYAAEKAAQRVASVKAIVEMIEVKLPGSHQRDDQDIAKAITNQFKWSVQVPDELVKASVEAGWVKLTGMVEWDFQRTAAEKCVRGLAGVVYVTNNISIRAKKIEPAIIKLKIQDALRREAELEAGRIAVDVQGDKVILTGIVRSFAEMQNAKWAAWSAPVVTIVENKMHVLGQY